MAPTKSATATASAGESPVADSIFITGYQLGCERQQRGLQPGRPVMHSMLAAMAAPVPDLARRDWYPCLFQLVKAGRTGVAAGLGSQRCGCNRAAATVQRRKPILLAVRAPPRGCDQINGDKS
jgi:hypothetical protein